MDERQAELSSEDLDISMTQVPLVLFIPYALAVGLGTGTFALGTFFHSWKVLFVLPIGWVLAAVWIRRDRSALDVMHVKVRLLAVWLTAHRWGGWSVDLPGDRHAL